LWRSKGMSFFLEHSPHAPRCRTFPNAVVVPSATRLLSPQSTNKSLTPPPSSLFSKGELITVCGNATLYQWRWREDPPRLIHSIELKRETYVPENAPRSSSIQSSLVTHRPKAIDPL
jgi:hypothetical protein